jgi:hypothetical protein
MRTGYSKRLFRHAVVAVVFAAAATAAQEEQQRPVNTPPQTAPKRGVGPAFGGGVGAGRVPQSGLLSGSGTGDGPPPQKSKLEEMLEKALKNNPDLRVAATKAQEAEAELNRTRLEVTRKVVRLHATLDAAKTNVAAAEQRLADVRKLADRQAVSKDDVRTAEKDLAAAKTDLATAEGEASYLLGESIWVFTHLRMNVAGSANEATPYLVDLGLPVDDRRSSLQQATRYLGAVQNLAGKTSKPAAEMAARIREALGTPMRLDYKDVPLMKVLKDFQGITDLVFVVRLEDEDPKVNLHLTDQPLGAVFQAITDQTSVSFIVRDYGILVLGAKHAVPGDAMSAHDFWISPAAPASPKKDNKDPGK